MAPPRFPLLSVDTPTHRRIVTTLAAIFVAAFAARLGARLVFGEAYF